MSPLNAEKVEVARSICHGLAAALSMSIRDGDPLLNSNLLDRLSTANKLLTEVLVSEGEEDKIGRVSLDRREELIDG